MRAAALVAIIAWQLVQLPSDVKAPARAVNQAATPLPQACQVARDRGAALFEELSRSVSPATKAAADQYIRKPAPGVSPEKARTDFAAGTLLMGDIAAAAWTALGEPDWTDETFANVGVSSSISTSLRTRCSRSHARTRSAIDRP